VGASRVRDLFQRRQEKPLAYFIDEVECGLAVTRAADRAATMSVS